MPTPLPSRKMLAKAGWRPERAVVVSAKDLAEHHEFPGLKAFGRIEATRDAAGAPTSETRHVALSWVPAPDVLLAIVRAHWAIENALHWQLDVFLGKTVHWTVF